MTVHEWVSQSVSILVCTHRVKYPTHSIFFGNHRNDAFRKQLKSCFLHFLSLGGGKKTRHPANLKVTYHNYDIACKRMNDGA